MADKKVAGEIDLDDVLLTPEATAAWHDIARRLALVARAWGLRKKQIPIERARVDGVELVIFARLKAPSGGYAEFDLRVPPDHWRYKDAQKQH